MILPRKSSQFTDEQWHQIELARTRMYAFKLKIQPYPLEELASAMHVDDHTNKRRLSVDNHRLDKFQGELVRLSDMFSKHIKGKQKPKVKTASKGIEL